MTHKKKNRHQKSNVNFAVTAWRTCQLLRQSRLWRNCPSFPKQKQIASPDFLGVNVASGRNAQTDDYVIARLHEIGIRHVRVDFSEDEKGDSKERFILRLLKEKFQTSVRLLQPIENAQVILKDKVVQQTWRRFIEYAASTFNQPEMEAFEIGATPNRKKWSGYRYNHYFKAWEIACDVLYNKNILLAGPNVSDFEPLHSIALLNGMQQVARLPNIHTVNLFVERMQQPEKFDTRVLGNFLSPLLRLNLQKKAAIFSDISQRFGIQKTWCTHTCWNARRVARWSTNVAQKQADYLVRYILLAAASGFLDRVYWGPLIGKDDGLISDGVNAPTGTERVARYGYCSDDLSKYIILPAFHAFRRLIDLFDGRRLEPIQYNPYFHIQLGDASCRWCEDGRTLKSEGISEHPYFI